MRMFLRALMSAALLLGGGVGDWVPVGAPAQESCCCGTPAGMPDACPCPKPEGTRSPTQTPCSNRPVTVVAAARAPRSQARPRTEPRPEPTTFARRAESVEATPVVRACQGRDPDLGRHLAHLSTFRI